MNTSSLFSNSHAVESCENIKCSNILPDEILCKTYRNAETASNKDELREIYGFRFPGIIDIHIHGAFGWDFSWGNKAKIEQTLDKLLECGYVGIVPTIITSSEDQTSSALADITAVAKNRIKPPKIYGIHLEGPFISLDKRGSHCTEYIKSKFDFELLKKWQNIAEKKIKLITLALELPNALESIQKIQNELGIYVSIGHSNCSYKIAKSAFELGCWHVTHMYNAMPSFHHRESTLLNAIFHQRDLAVELIGDCIHVAPEVIEFTFKYFSSKRISIVSDAVMPTGLPDGLYKAYDNTIRKIGGACYLENGQLFGGASLLLDCAKKIFSKTDISLSDISHSLFYSPCNALGVNPPKTDVLVDSEFHWLATKVDGIWYYKETNSNNLANSS